ncbi:hypothetical protein AFLA_001367 [Aspergillus flavus NRRL3357]|nr:hypothetical protein AFLA_001367 [Aspergillus flavus NRRL3357]
MVWLVTSTADTITKYVSLDPEPHLGGISLSFLRPLPFYGFASVPHRGRDWFIAIKCWGDFSANDNRRPFTWEKQFHDL